MDDATVQRVADELDIRTLVSKYSDAVASGNAEAWGDTWAEDGEWTVGPNTANGREAIVEQWKMLMGWFDNVIQLPQFGTLVIDGDKATGRWYVNELGRPKKGDPSYTLGLYRDEYIRTKDGWKFTSRRFDILYIGPPDLSGTMIPYPADA